MSREAFTVRTAAGREYVVIRDLGEHDAIGCGIDREAGTGLGHLTTYEGNHLVNDLGGGWYELVLTGERAQRVEGSD